MGQVQYFNRKMIDDYPILMVETLAIHKAVLPVIQQWVSTIISKSDSQMAIRAIKKDIKTLSKIINMNRDINILAKVWRNKKCLYCSMSITKFADRLSKRHIIVIFNRFFITDECFFLCKNTKE